MTSHRFRTGPADTGQRLDQVLAAHVPDLSRTKARAVLAEGGVFVDGHRTKVASRAVRLDQDIRVHLSPRVRVVDGGPSAEGPSFPLVHEDDHVLVVDKPAGVFSAPTPESDRNNLHRLLERQVAHELYLVHRLDRPTSGLMVFAKTRPAAASLSEQFQAHSVTRSYQAILVGRLDGDLLEVTVPLEGREARTRFESLALAPTASLARAVLFTGRTHQVRLHAEALGHPLAGDSKYGRFLARSLAVRAPRLALHAERLGFDSPGGKRLEFSSAFPAELSRYWQELGGVWAEAGGDAGA